MCVYCILRSILTCFDSADLGEAQRVSHGQIPVQRYAAEECDANVYVSVKDETKQLAALGAVDPVIMLEEVVYPQRKGGDVEEVGHGQVDQVDT